MQDIHVTEDRVWLVSNTIPRQIYLRIGLVHSVLKSPNGTDQLTRRLPAPSELQIGHAWQAIPLPDPILHTLNVDWLVAARERSETYLKDSQPLDALILTQTGEWLCLRILDEKLFFGSSVPISSPTGYCVPDILDLTDLELQSPSFG
ncbi:unnamed protein product [Echinostoma caproni]|uniref:CheW-like domain-containing protein n=1 Tax=Echinostoma caproni TaxID=27848 RepID=A0A183AC02_9TREM|nr:unnamed protein product [Echinostoma caproni]